MATEDASAGDEAAGTPGFSQSLERGLMILSAFSEARPVLGIAELARAVGLNKSTTYRYVATLARLGFVQQDPDTKKYSVRRRIIDVGFAGTHSMEITHVAAPHLQALAHETGCAVSMAVLDGPDIIYVDRRRSSRVSGYAIALNLSVGTRLPAYCTSMGKVLLAGCEPPALRSLLDRTDFARRGPKTITAREQLITVLAAVRQTGIASSDEEAFPGFRSLAAPVRDRAGRVVAAVDVAEHLTVWNAPLDSVVNRLAGPLRRTAGEVSARLGYRSVP
jgi:IclR family pca regulon transcriptional regulator